jgi:hypothetical protein
VIDLLYYRNCKGVAAVSVDEGKTVVLPNGREIPWQEAWEEVDEDLRAELTEAQGKTVALAEKVEWAKPKPIYRDDPDIANLLDGIGQTPVEPNPDLLDLLGDS